MTKHQLKVRHDVYKVLFFSLLVGMVFGAIKHQMQVQAESFEWPVNRDAIILEKEVEVLVEVPRLPKTVEEEIRAVFGKDAPTALRVAKCESGFNPKAKNKESSARGVFQIMQSWHGIKEKWLLNQSINVRVAYQLFTEQGWNPWKASRHCWGK